jgi:hypothetical protein
VDGQTVIKRGAVANRASLPAGDFTQRFAVCQIYLQRRDRDPERVRCCLDDGPPGVPQRQVRLDRTAKKEIGEICLRSVALSERE